MLLYIKAAASHTRRWKQSTTSNGGAFYSYDTLLLPELRSMYRAACKKHASISNYFLLLQHRRHRSPHYLCIIVSGYNASLLYDPADKRGNLAARAKALAQPFARAVEKHFYLIEEIILPTRAAEKNLPPPTARDYSQPGKRASVVPSRLGTELTFTALHHSKAPRLTNEVYKVMNGSLGSRNARDGKLA